MTRKEKQLLKAQRVVEKAQRKSALQTTLTLAAIVGLVGFAAVTAVFAVRNSQSEE